MMRKESVKEESRLIGIVEDHALMCHFIDSLVCSIENGTELPNFIPVLNDVMVSDQLSRIAETIQKYRTVETYRKLVNGEGL